MAMKLFPGTGVSNDSMHLWTYWYDPVGRRTLVADSNPSLAYPVKRFFYDGDNVVLVGDAYFQGGIDAQPVNLHGPRTNAFLNDLGVDRPLASVATTYDLGCGVSTNPPRNVFYHADERSSIRNLSWASDTVCDVAGFGYQGFGSSGGGAIPTDSRPGYTGAQSDASGLVFLRNRSYDPNTGTFTQPDPIGLLGGINLYGYVGNDPVGLVDPFGLCPDTLKTADGKCPG
jgi:RHS repeat-associated protein